MPRLFNAEKCLFQTFTVVSMTSNATSTQTFTGVTTDDYCFVLQNSDLHDTTTDGVLAAISKADTLMFSPQTLGAGSSVEQIIGVMVMVAPTSGQEGGSW
jgi:hypothetical protein